MALLTAIFLHASPDPRWLELEDPSCRATRGQGKAEAPPLAHGPSAWKPPITCCWPTTRTCVQNLWLLFPP